MKSTTGSYGLLTNFAPEQNFNDFNAQCSQQDVIDFMNATQEFMDNTDWLERYAWFGAMQDMQGVNEVWSPFSVSKSTTHC